MTFAPGSRFGPYEVVSPLGAGGMGEVYRAHDAKLGRDVAIKVLPEAFARDPDALARFEREVRAVAALSHPNILSIFDFGSHEGIAFAVMELLEGETLRQKLAAGPLPQPKVIEYGAQIARGLAAAHEKGIVHRDLKPENLFVTKDGHVKILDFGLARQVALPADAGDTRSPTLARPTEAGVILGTVAYMSPEQVQGFPVDHRADIFAFGCVLYELISGRRPFSGSSTVEKMHAILRDEPAELPAAVRGSAPELARLIATCLAKDPRERWQSAGDLARELSWLGSERMRDGVARGTDGRLPMRWLPWTVAVLVAAIAVGFAASRGKAPGPDPVVRFSAKRRVVIIELPGFKNEDLTLRVENGVLTLEGERKFEAETKERNYHRVERSYGKFVRGFTLPSNMNPEKIHANLTDGVLLIALPKKEETKPKTIQIGSGVAKQITVRKAA